MSDLFNLVRFIEAQDPVYARVCSELQTDGTKGQPLDVVRVPTD